MSKSRRRRDDRERKWPTALRLELSEIIHESVNELVNEAYLLGIGPEVRRALNTIFHRLQTDPLEFGELVGQYKSLKLLKHVAEVSPMVVHFCIHQDLKIVFVQKIYRI